MEQYRVCSTCRQSKPFSAFNKDRSRKFGISYRCKECHSQMNLKYYDKEKFRVHALNHYHRNRDVIVERQRKARRENPEKVRAYNREYYRRNKKRINELSNKWRRENPESGRAAKRKRRATKAKNGYAPYSTQQVLELYGSNCYLCNEPIDLEAPRWTAKQGWERGLHIDHVVRIADGGADTLENVRPTHGACNLSKH